MIYTIQMNYKVQFTSTIEANDEGEALSKAREMAENADINDFTFVEELESQIVQQINSPRRNNHNLDVGGLDEGFHLAGNRLQFDDERDEIIEDHRNFEEDGIDNLI